MNNDIKEILDNLQYGGFCWKRIYDEEIKKILDYITNLQQKVEQYENPDDLTLFYMWLDEKAKDKMKALQEENERLAIELNNCMIERNNFLSRNEKAIEYIKENCIDDEFYINLTYKEKHIIKALEILKGD